MDKQPRDPTRPPITALGSISIAIMAQEGGFEFNRPYYFDPDYRWEQDVAIARWAEGAFAPASFYNAEAHLVQLDYLPRPFRQVGGIQPNLLLAAALGAEFVFYGDHDPDVEITPAARPADLPPAEPIRWEEREPFATFLHQIDELQDRYRGSVDIIPPFFWDRSGRAAIHGPISTAMKLLGNSFLLMLMDDFDHAMAVLQWIQQAYQDLIQLFADRAELPITGIHIGECAGCMLSPQDWERSVLPVASTMGASFGAVRMHSCGLSDHLLEPMARIHNLKVVNIGSQTSIARCRALMGPEIKIDVIPDAKLFTTGTREEIVDWVNQSLEENRGGPLEFQFHLEPAVPIDNSLAIFGALVEQGYQPYNDSLLARWNV